MVQRLWKIDWLFLIKLNTDNMQPSNAIPDIYQNKLKNYVYTKTLTWRRMVALFIIAKTGNNQDVLWWENERTVMCPYFSAVKRNKLLIHTKTWVNLKHILLSKGSQFERVWWNMTNGVCLHLYDLLWKRKNHRDWKHSTG